MTVTFKTELEILKDIAFRAKETRLSQNLTQEFLAQKSGVSLGSLKRFETSGKASLKLLVKISCALGNLRQFENLFQREETVESLAQIRKKTRKRKRGGKSVRRID